MVPDLTKNQIVVWVPPSTLEIGDLLRSGTFSQLSGTSQVTGGPRSQQVPEFKSSTCTAGGRVATQAAMIGRPRVHRAPAGGARPEP